MSYGSFEIPRAQRPLDALILEVVHQFHQPWLGLLVTHCFALNGLDLVGGFGLCLYSWKTADMMENVDLFINAQCCAHFPEHVVLRET